MLGLLTLALIVLAALLVPWRTLPGAHVLATPAADFTVAERHRETAFHGALRAWTYPRLLLVLAVAVALGLSSWGARLVAWSGRRLGGSWPATVLAGTVERHESFGIFVRLGPGQTGLVPTGELSMNRGADARKTFPVGSEIKVMVLAIEEGGRRIRLSHAQALAREEQAETQAYLRQGGKRGDGFGLTLGEAIKQGRPRQPPGRRQ